MGYGTIQKIKESLCEKVRKKYFFFKEKFTIDSPVIFAISIAIAICVWWWVKTHIGK
jgi:hypothetical protein